MLYFFQAPARRQVTGIQFPLPPTALEFTFLRNVTKASLEAYQVWAWAAQNMQKGPPTGWRGASPLAGYWSIVCGVPVPKQEQITFNHKHTHPASSLTVRAICTAVLYFIYIYIYKIYMYTHIYTYIHTEWMKELHTGTHHTFSLSNNFTIPSNWHKYR